MEQHKNFVVYGPGRTGSHWVESIVIGQVSPAEFNYKSCHFFPDGWIYHSNSIDELLTVPREVRNSVTLIVCDRSNYFDAAVSYFVAEHTDEWFIYTDKPVVPFNVDSDAFISVLDGLYTACQLIKSRVEPMYNRMIRVDYDQLVSAAIPEKYVADLLSIDYIAESLHTRNSFRNKNTRKYQELVLNWNQLVDIYQNHTVDH